MNDNNQEAWRAFGEDAYRYHEQYSEVDFKKGYPDNQKRLTIALDIAKRIKPKTVLDIGCGSGEPLLEFLKAGYDAHGFDFSDDMVLETQTTLRNGGFEESRVTKNDMENPQGIESGSFDAVMALGSLFYARDFDSTIKAAADAVKSGGHLVASFRNELFSLFSMNKYTSEFISKNLISDSEIPEEARKLLEGDFDRIDKIGAIEKHLFTTVDERKIHSQYHNPLTIAHDVLNPIGLELVDTFYYHFHVLPPKFEHLFPAKFRQLSWDMENPRDWRGIFMASTFVVTAKKTA